ncbi:MAG: hypothetical protein OXH52_06570 [Gammaproteobacteria bacterium]|nr:hypothetical protein [Gammaproteobacteria bacterium]
MLRADLLPRGFCWALGATISLAGCVTETVRVVDKTPPERIAAAIPEELLLDVGVSVFDANVPEEFDEQIKANIHPDVRRAEGNYLAYHLKNLLQSTGNWGAVRVVPRATHAVDVTVEATIQESDGESLALRVRATDVMGEVWFDREYRALASKYAYETAFPREIDPFQSVYRDIANDMVAHLKTLTPEEVRKIRAAAEMRFARDFVPDAFASYITPKRSGGFELRRLPADGDQNLQRVRRVREREYLFIDTLDEYYETFSTNMFSAYQNWRHATYDEAIAHKRLKQQARSRAIAGSAAVIGGIATQATAESWQAYYGGIVGIIGGAALLRMALNKRAEAQVSADMLQELGNSADAAISPHTIELENQVLQLQGSVDAQYQELRRILKMAYYRDLGMVLPDAPEGLEDQEPSGDGALRETPQTDGLPGDPGGASLRETDDDSTFGQGQDGTDSQAPAPGHASRSQ